MSEEKIEQKSESKSPRCAPGGPITIITAIVITAIVVGGIVYTVMNNRSVKDDTCEVGQNPTVTATDALVE